MNPSFTCESCGQAFGTSKLFQTDSLFICDECGKATSGLRARVMQALRDPRVNVNQVSKHAGLSQTLRRAEVRASEETLVRVRSELLDLAYNILENLE